MGRKSNKNLMNEKFLKNIWGPKRAELCETPTVNFFWPESIIYLSLANRQVGFSALHYGTCTLRSIEILDRIFIKCMCCPSFQDDLIAHTATPPMYLKTELQTFDMKELNSKFDVILVEPPLEEYQRTMGVTNMQFWGWDQVRFILWCELMMYLYYINTKRTLGEEPACTAIRY